jgi:FkbM family methyltransferase
MSKVITNETDFINQIESSLDYKILNREIVDIFLSKDDSVSRYVIGKNNDTVNISKIVRIEGVIDDYSSLSYWKEFPIIKSSAIDDTAIVLNCSTSISPVEVIKNMQASGVKNLINLSDIIFHDKANFLLPDFVKEMRFEWERNKSKFYNLYLKLNDIISKKIYVDLLSFRLSANLGYMMNYSVRLNDQYFESFMNYSSETYVDVGGYDGDTTELFCLYDKNYKKVFLFEPSTINMSAAKNRLSKFNNIHYYLCGLSDKKEELSFNENNGSSSSISESGTIKISTTTLDEEIAERISVIKMDIEGWELNALKGCVNHIVNDKPKLAITVYHSAKDFIEISDYILSLNSKYNLYLRHYTSGWSETVMYFVPNPNSLL